MRNTKWLGLLASAAFPLLSAHGQAPVSQAPDSLGQAQTTASVPVNISPGAAEVVKLAESGVGEDVIMAFIQNSKSDYDLSADDVLYLNDVGLTSSVITAMLNHDKAVRTPSPQYAPTPKTPVAPTNPQPAAPSPPAPAPAYVSNPPVEVNYFYNELSPYGTWVVLDGYGWCWQPRAVVINRGWQPYCDGGRWIYSDAGWYWQSDYSWGWAPFHYGRWQLHGRHGWVWLPDRVWGPAWVTWRVAGDNCGWAPLPPHATFDVRLGWRFNGISVGVGFDFGLHFDHFVFIGLGDFCHRDVRGRRLPETHVKNIYQQTTVINNYTVNNTTVVNHGIPVTRVSAATQTEIRKATIREVPRGSERALRTQGDTKRGLVVYRPQLTAPKKSEKIVAQKLDERHPAIQHTRIAPMAVERKSQLGNSAPPPTTAPRRSPSEISRSPQRPKTEKSPSAFQQDQAAPRISQPTPTIPTSPAPTRSPQERKQPARATPADRSDTGASRVPSQGFGQGQPNAGQNNSSQKNPPYYPKGFYQNSEIRSAPRPSQRQDAPPNSQPGQRPAVSSSRPGSDKNRP